MKSKVYFTSDLTPKGLVKIYKALNKELKGNVAVKISTGEMGGENYLKPNLIKDLVELLNGTIVECNTAYKGMRENTKDHLEVILKHGFLGIAVCDIMDSDGSMEIPINGGIHLDKDIVGSHLKNYDSMLVLSHFKGHAMGGFGGALKNMSIGIASREGKAWIHSVGVSKDPKEIWGLNTKQEDFLESMADACKGVVDYIGSDNLVYINVLNNISIDCDCDANPDKPLIADIGIYASIDPVAIDKASYDTVMSLEDKNADALKMRINKQKGEHTIYMAEKLGLGSTDYEIINI